MAAKQFSRPGRMWFVSDGYIWDDYPAQTRREVGGRFGATGVADGPASGGGPGRPLECSSKLFVYNPQATAASVTARFFHTDREPTSVAFPVAPGTIHELELAALSEIPHRQAFWITIESDLPVLPQARHEDFTFWDVVPDALTAVAPYPGPLEDETSWMLIDCFQGDCGSWYERESITILNPGPDPASVRVRYLFRSGGGAEEAVKIPPGRVAWLHGEDRIPKVIGAEGPLGAGNLMARLRWEYNVRIDADRPVIAQSTRRARWVGFPSIIGSRSTMAIPVRADWPDRWYFPGGEIVDYGLLPRPKADTHALAQCDNTWNLLFIANRASQKPAQARLTIHKPDGEALQAEPMTVPPDRTVLQCLHAKPWLGPYTKVGEPFAMTVTGDGPGSGELSRAIAPSVCGAEFEMWSQVCPGAMTAVNFYGGPLTTETQWWLGIGHAGGDDESALEWRQSYHFFNPTSKPVEVQLCFCGLTEVGRALPAEPVEPVGRALPAGADANPEEAGNARPTTTFALTLAPGAVARVKSADLPTLPMGKPFAVRAVGDGPFCAQVYGRSFTRGLPHPRAMYSFIGVPMKLA